MPVPAKRISKRRTRTRRSHQALAKLTIATCPQCGQTTRPHHACAHCGYYRGRDVLQKQRAIEKQLRKRDAKTKGLQPAVLSSQNAAAPAVTNSKQ